MDFLPKHHRTRQSATGISDEHELSGLQPKRTGRGRAAIELLPRYKHVQVDAEHLLLALLSQSDTSACAC